MGLHSPILPIAPLFRRRGICRIFLWQRDIHRHVESMKNDSTYVAQWFNPRDGQYKNIGTFSQKGSQWVIPDRPTAEDWVLLVKKAETADRTAKVLPSLMRSPSRVNLRM